ncbi:MAG: undecaprenyl/decaprenyl-phosphate alpha-N-acetylglucosaminyl 1-phosphate transferase [Steroidobacteraceae bacterium]|nr:undecaprenyl/decaprenyl-phosphate alpha-N-acetylglucosaminyl 1-phosphate transferase [Steroidobacteraceae bacterium]
MTAVIFGAVASFFVCLLAIIALRPVAVVVDLVDKPGGRKTHHGEVPIVGGIAMFLGLSVGLGLVPSDPLRSETFIAACALLVVTGMLDDRFVLSPWLRLPAQAAATLLVVTHLFSSAGFSFGNPLGFGDIDFHGLAAYVVILFFVVGAINAFNMLDGMDGLAGAVSLVALAGVSVLAWSGGLQFTLQVCFTLAGAVGAFLLFNLPIRRNRGVRCFMGDAGSTLIGFILALLCMRLTQGQSRIMAPVSVLWLVALPVFELLWTIIRRTSRGQSPFAADREHFHHLLVDSGLGVRGAFIVYVLFATLLAAAGLAFHEIDMPESLQFALFVLTGIFTVMLMYRAPVLVAHLPADWHRKPTRRVSGDA